MLSPGLKFRRKSFDFCIGHSHRLPARLRLYRPSQFDRLGNDSAFPLAVAAGTSHVRRPHRCQRGHAPGRACAPQAVGDRGHQGKQPRPARRHRRGTAARHAQIQRPEQAAAQVPRHLPAGGPRRPQGPPRRGTGQALHVHGPMQDPRRPGQGGPVSRRWTSWPASTPTARCASPPARAFSSTASSRATSRRPSPASTAVC